MHFSKAFLLSVFIALVGAQSEAESLVGQIPSCADACLEDAAQKNGCDVTDFACQCPSAKMNAITLAATPCVLKACSVSEAQKVQKVTAEICDIIAPEDSDDEGDESPTTASPTIGDVVVATTSCVVTSTILANASATSSAAPEEFTGAAGSVQVTAGMLFGAGAAVAAAIL